MGKRINPYLDYIRAIAAILVVLYHYTHRYEQLFNHVQDYPIVVSHGSYGVLVFFLLSGYLVTRGIAGLKPMTFAIKRFFRLYPVYWVALCFTMLICTFFLPELRVSLKDFLLNFTMLQDAIGGKSVDGAYWTLLPELLFYFLVWLICMFKWNNKFSEVVIVWGVIQVVVYFVTADDHATFLYKVNNLMYSHCFMAGASLALIESMLASYKLSSQPVLGVKIFLLGCTLFFCVAQQFIYHEQASGIFFVVTVIVVVLAIIAFRLGNTSIEIGKLMLFKFLSWIAAISYPIYLLHQNIGYVIIKTMESHRMTSEWWLLLPIMIIVGLAYLLDRYVGGPVARKASDIIKKIN